MCLMRRVGKKLLINCGNNIITYDSFHKERQSLKDAVCDKKALDFDKLRVYSQFIPEIEKILSLTLENLEVKFQGEIEDLGKKNVIGGNLLKLKKGEPIITDCSDQCCYS